MSIETMKLHGMWVVFHSDVLMTSSSDRPLTLQFRNFSVSVFSISLYVYWFRLIFYKCSQIKLRALQKPSKGTLEATIAKGPEWGLEKINKNQGQKWLILSSLQSSSWWLLWTELHRFFFFYFLLCVGFPSRLLVLFRLHRTIKGTAPLLSQGGLCLRYPSNKKIIFLFFFFPDFQEYGISLLHAMILAQEKWHCQAFVHTAASARQHWTPLKLQTSNITLAREMEIMTW